MNTLTKMVAVAAIGCAVGGAVSSLAVAQVPKGLVLSLPFECALSYKGSAPSSTVTVTASNTAQAEQMAVTAATPTGASCKMKESNMVE